MKNLLLTAILVLISVTSVQAEMFFNHNTGVWENGGASVVQSSNTKSEAPSSFCSSKWGNDYVMVEHCMNSQGKAANNLIELKKVNEGSSVFNTIYNTCAVKWYDGQEFDFVMIEHCVNSQIDAYNNINR